ncbi:DUF6045 family protein [Paenibacillus alvei]|uniref:DUF6045 family protein n=1 Tax=Paenibacillus alvei TaxID=44250 RepID=A0ABT4H2K9_PAEAL|nr:conjugal transfer protein TrbL family protein [Paenibacillus alvei]MCY9763217.1 DUF6045 family protein [Paenibacillus alvei]MCY9769494.1 DUF6045 family protein [Paenibacillus alvei]
MLRPQPLWNPIGDMIQESIEKWFTNLAADAVNAFLEFLNAVNGISSSVLDLPVVIDAIAYSQALALAILVAKFAFEIWYNNMLRQDGDSDSDLSGVMIRGSQAIAVVCAVPWIVRQAYKWGSDIAGDVAALPGVNYETMRTPLEQLIHSALSSQFYPLLISLAVLFALIILIIVLVQTFIRAAELAVAAAVGSFMALGLTNPNSQAFQSWWREVLNLSLAQAVQMFLIKCSFFALLNFNAAAWVNVMLFVGFVWVTYKSPTILKQYVYSTGFGRATAGAAQQVGSMAIMRRVMAKGVK